MPAITQVRALIRRHRRILAACCAGLAALLTVSAIRSPQTPPGAPTGPAGEPTLQAGEVAVPVTLASTALAAALDAGDVIDLVAVPRADDGATRIVAREATVLSVAEGGFGAPDASVIVIAVPRADALAIAGAMTNAAFTPWVTTAIPTGTAGDR